jgi:mRNA-degrading endonuclease RelE of RelBE toxin-antitoxin system
MKELVFCKRVKKQISKFPLVIQKFLLDALEKLEREEMNMDIKKVQGETDTYRLRKGNYRIFF